MKIGGSLRMRNEDLLTHLRSNENERVLWKRPKVLSIRFAAQETILLKKKNDTSKLTISSVKSEEVKPVKRI